MCIIQTHFIAQCGCKYTGHPSVLSYLHIDPYRPDRVYAGKGTEINIRRLFLNLSLTHDNAGSRVIASLDAEKVFDSVEWEYLWGVLKNFGFGPGFLHWIQLLYQAQRARVGTNNRISDPFPLHRGTRQGCPLSPSLFGTIPLCG